jgi:hypothetical protein
LKESAHVGFLLLSFLGTVTEFYNIWTTICRVVASFNAIGEPKKSLFCSLHSREQKHRLKESKKKRRERKWNKGRREDKKGEKKRRKIEICVPYWMRLCRERLFQGPIPKLGACL